MAGGLMQPEESYNRCRLYFWFCFLRLRDDTLAITSLPLSKPVHPHISICVCIDGIYYIHRVLFVNIC